VLTGSAAYLFLGYRCPNEWGRPSSYFPSQKY
jgi:hypothetical protein